MFSSVLADTVKSTSSYKKPVRKDNQKHGLQICAERFRGEETKKEDCELDPWSDFLPQSSPVPTAVSYR
jgi:hypothetical protein